MTLHLSGGVGARFIDNRLFSTFEDEDGVHELMAIQPRTPRDPPALLRISLERLYLLAHQLTVTEFRQYIHASFTGDEGTLQTFRDRYKVPRSGIRYSDVAADAEHNDRVSKDALASKAMPHLMRALQSQHNIVVQIGSLLVRYSVRRDLCVATKNELDQTPFARNALAAYTNDEVMAQRQDGKVRVTTFYVVEEGDEKDEKEGATVVQDGPPIQVTTLHFAVWPATAIEPSGGAYLAHDLRDAAMMAARARHGSHVGVNLVFIADDGKKVRSLYTLDPLNSPELPPAYASILPSPKGARAQPPCW